MPALDETGNGPEIKASLDALVLAWPDVLEPISSAVRNAYENTLAEAAGG